MSNVLVPLFTVFILLYFACFASADDDLWEKFPKTYTTQWTQSERNEVSKEIRKGTQTVWSLYNGERQYQKRMENLTTETVFHLARSTDNSYYGWILDEAGLVDKCTKAAIGEDIPNTFQWLKETNPIGPCPAPYNKTENKLYVLMKESGITTICVNYILGVYYKPIYFEFKSNDGNLLLATIEHFNTDHPTEDIFTVPTDCTSHFSQPEEQKPKEEKEAKEEKEVKNEEKKEEEKQIKVEKDVEALKIEIEEIREQIKEEKQQVEKKEKEIKEQIKKELEKEKEEEKEKEQKPETGKVERKEKGEKEKRDKKGEEKEEVKEEVEQELGKVEKKHRGKRVNGGNVKEEEKTKGEPFL